MLIANRWLAILPITQPRHIPQFTFKPPLLFAVRLRLWL